MIIELDSKHQYVKEAQCTCPYDKGLYCKHIAAVMYRLTDEMNHQDIDGFITDLKKKSKDELIDIIIELSNEYPSIRNRVSSNNLEDEIDLIIDSYLDDYMDDGYISYKDVHKAIKGFEIALNKIQFSDPKDQFHMCIEIIKKWLDVYQDIDDSDGYLSNIKYEALHIFQLATKEVEFESDVIEDIQKLTLLIREDSESYLDDVYIEMLRMLSPLARFEKTKEILKQLINELFEIKNDRSYIKYYKDELADIYYSILSLSNQVEADEWMLTHLNYHSMKIRAIDKAFDDNNYPLIIQICMDSIQQEKGYEKEYYVYLVKAYQMSRQDDLAKIYMKKLILLGDTTYYQIYKTTFDSNAWKIEVDHLLSELEKEKYTPPIYEKIMIDEKCYDKLLSYVKENQYKVFELYMYFPKGFQDSLESMMKNQVFNQFKSGSNKKDYQYRSHYLDTYVKAYGNELAKELIVELKTTFKNRRALHEVLDLFLMKIR